MRSLLRMHTAALLLAAGCLANDARTPDTVRATPSQDSASLAASAAPVVTPAGIGAVRIGTVIGALAPLTEPSSGRSSPSHMACGYATVKTMPAGVRLFVLNDSIARIDVDSAGVRTAEGVGVGDTEARVLEVYGARAHVAPHKYTGPTGHDVTVVTADDTLARIVFETDGTHVVSYHAGRLPAVALVEGCG